MTFQAFRFHLGIAAAILAAAPANGRDVKTAKEAMIVCGDFGGLEGPGVAVGQGVAAQILHKAGISLQWRSSNKACTGPGGGLIVSTSVATPVGKSPGVMASASVFEGRHVVVFADRLQKTFRRDQVGVVLGHVLAHEIVHLLQGLDRHSEQGLMKAKWELSDYDEMRRKPMDLPEQDLDFIQDGMRTRKSLAAQRRAWGE